MYARLTYSIYYGASKLRVLVTGGAGYIGSHTLIELLAIGCEVLVLDDLSNSSTVALNQVKLIAKRDFEFIKGDIRDANLLVEIFSCFKPEVVLHLAGFKSVTESVDNPLFYYSNNVSGSVQLLEVMSKHECTKIVFSSSATVYGAAKYLPYDEDHPTNPINPYGRTKIMIESIISDWCKANVTNSAIALRYFNPVGAHSSSLIGESPCGTPNNLMPLIVQVAAGEKDKLKIFGKNYNTRDGTGARDYIHVLDLASAHLSAINYLKNNVEFSVFNVGTGRAITILELIEVFERVSGTKIEYEFAAERHGDLAIAVSDPSKAEKFLRWKAKYTVEDMCRDTWNWQINKPKIVKGLVSSTP